MAKPVLVAGLGLSGIQAADLLLKTGNQVVLYDGNDKKDTEEIRGRLKEMQAASGASYDTEGIRFVLGELPADVIRDIELCVISPGISLEVPFAAALK
ncbi:MAG: hypothetical protein IKR59_04190, partial [Lachnospiraceae bacterium]|nr:hypothetical protein [Lachnospiraceae bacterium]